MILVTLILTQVEFTSMNTYPHTGSSSEANASNFGVRKRLSFWVNNSKLRTQIEPEETKSSIYQISDFLNFVPWVWLQLTYQSLLIIFALQVVFIIFKKFKDIYLLVVIKCLQYWHIYSVYFHLPLVIVLNIIY